MKTTEPTFINLELSGNCSPLLFTSLACFCLQLSDTALWFRDCFSYATWKKRRAVIIIDQPIRFHFVRKLITRQHNVVNIDYFATQSLLFFFLHSFGISKWPYVMRVMCFICWRVLSESRRREKTEKTKKTIFYRRCFLFSRDAIHSRTRTLRGSRKKQNINWQISALKVAGSDTRRRNIKHKTTKTPQNKKQIVK